MRGRLFIPALLALCCTMVSQTLAAAVAAPAVDRPTGLLQFAKVGGIIFPSIVPPI